MKDYFKFMGIAVLVVLSAAFIAGITGVLNFASFAFWAPKVEQVRYNTFKQSQSYNDGMLRDLQELKMQYLQATPDQKIALKAIVLHRFGAYNPDMLPPDLLAFYLPLRSAN